MRDSTGHVVHYNPGEPPEYDEPEPSEMQQIIEELHEMNGWLGSIHRALRDLVDIGKS